ncbi:MAG: substrate-binding domain-containing protein [Dichotomicrobium sp.]
MNTKFLALTAAVAVAGAFSAGQASARDQISIVGSSTVFPYTQAVAEEFANKTGSKAPVVESTGTGGGMKIFCQGVGVDHPDITGGSRAIKQSEKDLCLENGVDNVTEVQIGSDGLSLAVSREGKSMDLTKTEIYQALAAQVPVDGELVDNPHQKWSDINEDLPDIEIIAYGPPPTSGTRDAFVELAMVKGCMEMDFFKDKGEEFAEENCSAMRQDGPFVEAGENDNLIVQRLEADPNAYGIFGYSFLFENQDKLKAVAVEGVEPSAETIETGEYGISRPLFFYIKNAHRDAIPGMKDFIEEYVSEAAFGPGGYLTERGLVPLGDSKREQAREAALNGTNNVFE